MTKTEFLNSLRSRLEGLPPDYIEETLLYYSEIIDDYAEDGLSEEEAVFGLGDIDTIVSKAREDVPLTKLIRDIVKPGRSLRWWNILCLILGSPIWVSLLVAALSVVFSLYAVLWSVVISVYAVAVSFVAVFAASVPTLVLCCIDGNVAMGLLWLGIGILFAGLSIFVFILGNLFAKGAVFLGKKIGHGIKWIFTRGGKRS